MYLYFGKILYRVQFLSSWDSSQIFDNLLQKKKNQKNVLLKNRYFFNTQRFQVTPIHSSVKEKIIFIDHDEFERLNFD